MSKGVQQQTGGMADLLGSRQASPAVARHIASVDPSSAQSSHVGRMRDAALVPRSEALATRSGRGGWCRFLAQKCPEEGPDAAQRKKDFEEQRAALVSALAAKVGAGNSVSPQALPAAEFP